MEVPMGAAVKGVPTWLRPPPHPAQHVPSSEPFSYDAILILQDGGGSGRIWG